MHSDSGGKTTKIAFDARERPSRRPVTDVLMKALGRRGNRPAHVHFFIEAPGYRTLTTQINFGDDLSARDDFAFGTRLHHSDVNTGVSPMLSVYSVTYVPDCSGPNAA